MPSRNRIKVYIPETYYHVYNRGINKKTIFIDNYDYSVFLNLLKRYLSEESVKDKKGREYESLSGEIELLAFCLMPNHFHLLIYQNDSEAITKLIRRVSTSYASYFNKRYKRSGPLFQERFKASQIAKDEYLQHISRYIHLNPADYKNWEYSTIDYYFGRKNANWIKPDKILALFEKGEYPQFLKDYKEHKKVMDMIKGELANTIT